MVPVIVIHLFAICVPFAPHAGFEYNITSVKLTRLWATGLCQAGSRFRLHLVSNAIYQQIFEFVANIYWNKIQKYLKAWRTIVFCINISFCP